MTKKLLESWNKQNRKEIARYIIAGICTTIVGLGSYYGLTAFIWNPQIYYELIAANTLSWIISVGFAYYINKRFVFGQKNVITFKEVLMFYSGRVFTLLLESVLMLLMVTGLRINDKISKILVAFVVVIANYVISKFVVFKKK